MIFQVRTYRPEWSKERVEQFECIAVGWDLNMPQFQKSGSYTKKSPVGSRYGLRIKYMGLNGKTYTIANIIEFTVIDDQGEVQFLDDPELWRLYHESNQLRNRKYGKSLKFNPWR